MEPIRQALGDPSLSLTKVFLDFLRGKEAPCPQHLSAASIYFPNVIDLSRIGEEGFRAKHFCWAATGSYEWELGVSPIKVGMDRAHLITDESIFLGTICTGWRPYVLDSPPELSDGLRRQILICNMLSECVYPH